MKVKNGQLVVASEVLRKLLAQSFSVKTSLALVKLSKLMKSHVDDVNSVREKLVKEYGKEEPGKGFVIKPTDSNYQQIISKLNELFELEVDFNFDEVKILATDDLKISGDDIENIKPFVIIYEDEVKK